MKKNHITFPFLLTITTGEALRSSIRASLFFFMFLLLSINVGAQQCYITLSPNPVQFPLSGGAVWVDVNAAGSCPQGLGLSIYDIPSWVTAYIAGGDIYVSAASTGSYRTASIPVRSNGITVNAITVTQGTYTPPPPPVCTVGGFGGSAFDSLGQTINFPVTFSNCGTNSATFTFQTSTGQTVPGWVSLSQNGTSITVTCGPNSTGSQRTVIILATTTIGGSPHTIGGQISQASCLQTWYLDADNDGHAISTQSACTSPGSGYSLTVKPLGDCNDSNATVYPGAPEICNDGLDNNCNGSIDENRPTVATGNNVARCGPGTVNLTAGIGSGGNAIRWYSAATGGTLLATSTTYTTPTLSATTTYYAESYSTAVPCAAATRKAIQAVINPIPAEATGSNVSRCGTGTVNLTAGIGTGGNNIRWYNAATGGTLLATSTSYTTPSLSATTTYYAESFHSTTGCYATSRKAIQAVINTIPAVATGSNVSRCGTGTVSLTASIGTGGNNIRWYSAATGGTLLATSTSYTTPSLSATTTYYAESFNSTTGCYASSRKAIQAVINSIPAVATGSNISRCGTGTVTLTAGIGTGGNNIRWYSAATGGTHLATSTSYTTPSLSATTTYYAESFNSTTGCYATSRKAIQGVINPIPAVATGSNVSRCGNGTVTLTAGIGTGGNNIRWYSAATGGTLLATSTSYTTPSLSATTTYYAESFNSTTGCYATSRKAIQAVINPVPAVATGSNVSRCGTGTVSLTAGIGTGGNNIRWYSAATGGTLLATSTTYTTPSLSATTTYYAESFNSTTGCAATSRKAIQAVINTMSTWYSDADGDGFGDPAVSISVCTAPAGYVANNTDGCPTEAGINNGCNYAPAVLSNENYIYTRTFQEPMADESGIMRDTDIIENITYFDGLGRPKQSIGIKASPTKKDIITHVGYDTFGRQDKDWLPYHEGTGSVGSYRGDKSLATQQYYQANYPVDFMNVTNAPDINAFSQKGFEASPLDRVLLQAAPGKDWKLGGGHEIGFGYMSNAALEVVKFEVTIAHSTVDNIKVFEPTLIKNATYGAGELYKTVTKDENWTSSNALAHTTEEFKDKQGRVVLKRTYGASDINMDGDTIDPGEANAAHDTYYVYDDYGNLTYVVPPKVNVSDGVSATELSELCYQYKYDSRNRLVEKKVPGKGWEYIIYNKLDQPIMTQDANLRASSMVLYTAYDAFGRMAVTGGISTGTAISRTMMQASADMVTTQYVTASATPITIAGTPVYYTAGDLSVAYISEIHTINYYDAYRDLPSGLGATATTYYGLTSSTSTKGLPTVSKVRALDSSNLAWITTVNYYDHKGRPIYTYVANPYLGTVDIMEGKLDFTGRVLESRTTHKKSGKADIVAFDYFTYDHVGRLLAQRNKINTLAEETIVSNTYDNLGQLTVKGVGGKSTQGRLQTVNYAYNVRGWLKQINDPTTLGTDLFAFKINYNTVGHGGTPLYNGNIAETEWRTANTDNSLHWYRYGYDALNRLRNATDNLGKLNENLNYDKNGNITTLVRLGHIVGGTTVADINNALHFGTMDNLVYTYEATSNKLRQVLDNGNDTYGFKDSAVNDQDYWYDGNGNMTKDDNKGITSIAYNHLNLPGKVIFSGTNRFIDYIYDATGTKLKKKVTDGASVTETFYAGNHVYEGSSLKFFGQSEGYVDAENGYKYVYQYKDHLGNVRLSYQDTNGSGSINTSEILEENNYYPFGLEHKGYNNVVNGTEYNYKRFLGQEMNKELGLNWLTFRYRNYMPDIGRFFGSDPIAEDFYSISNYQFAHNNPIWKIELEGLEGKALSGVDVVNREPVTYTTEIDGRSVSFQTRRVYVRDYTVTSTGNGGYSAFDNGGSYQTRVKSNDAGSNNWYGDTEYNYTVYEQGANEPITISTQSEQSTTVPGMIEEKYSPSDENKARALENTGGTLENAGDGGVVAFTLSKTPIGLALSQTASLTGVGLNLAADAERNQYGKAGKKVGTEIITEVGARVVEKKSNWIKAAYEAVSSWFDNTVND